MKFKTTGLKFWKVMMKKWMLLQDNNPVGFPSTFYIYQCSTEKRWKYIYIYIHCQQDTEGVGWVLSIFNFLF